MRRPSLSSQRLAAARLRSSALAALVAGSALLAPSVSAQAAAGTFSSGGRTLELRDAYAFRGASSLGGDSVLLVAVSNAGFVGEVLDEYWDRRRAIDAYFRDDETGVVYFEFRDDGSYKGLSYYWEPGNGCGFCSDPGVKSTVTLRNGSLSGSLRSTEAERPFDVRLDVRIAADDHGPAQGAGGGAPGKAFLAYHRALVAGDRAALEPRLSAERREVWDNAERAGDLEGFLEYLGSTHPSSVQVAEGYVKGDHAILLVTGEASFGKVRGEVSMRLEDGAWRFEEETLEPGD